MSNTLVCTLLLYENANHDQEVARIRFYDDVDVYDAISTYMITNKKCYHRVFLNLSKSYAYVLLLISLRTLPLNKPSIKFELIIDKSVDQKVTDEIYADYSIFQVVIVSIALPIFMLFTYFSCSNKQDFSFERLGICLVGSFVSLSISVLGLLDSITSKYSSLYSNLPIQKVTSFDLSLDSSKIFDSDDTNPKYQSNTTTAVLKR